MVPPTPLHDESAVAESPHSSPHPSPHPSRRPSMVAPRPVPHHSVSSLSRRSSLASGPRPITRAEYSGDATPSLLSRAGSPVQPLANEKVQSRKSSFAGQHPGHVHLGGLGGLGGFSALDTRRELRHGNFIGSVDCGTTWVGSCDAGADAG